jgi:hypothetical protein
MIRIGIDTSKHLLQLHGVNVVEQTMLRKKQRRKDVIAFFEKLPATVIAIEACGASSIAFMATNRSISHRLPTSLSRPMCSADTRSRPYGRHGCVRQTSRLL